MATGDVTVFNEAKLGLVDGTHDLDTHTIKCAILDNTTAPAAADATPALADYTQVGVAGTYVSGGQTLTMNVTQTTGTVTVDSTTNPVWGQDAGNDVDAYWGLIYNDTDAGKAAIAYVELGGPVDMTAGTLTINWNANGIFTLA